MKEWTSVFCRAACVACLALPAPLLWAGQIPPQTQPHVQAPATPQVAPPPAQDPSYELGPEDAVTVAVNKHPDFSGDFLIPPDGIVDFPAVGKVNVIGMSLSKLHDLINNKLGERLQRPEVSVILKSQRVMRAYVTGDVLAPMTIDVKRGWRITEALSATGGLVKGLEPADVTVTIIDAATSKTTQIALTDAQSGDPAKDLLIKPGDVIDFKSVATMPVYVGGWVKVPGFYRIRTDGPGIMEAITLAGGITDTTAGIGHVSVTHTNSQQFNVDLTPAFLRGEKLNLPRLQSGDVIMVPQAQTRIAVVGLVKSPGIYPVPDGQEFRITDAIALAQGSDPHRARLGKVAVVRRENGVDKHTVYNLARFYAKGDFSQNPILKDRDFVFIPETNSFDWSTVTSVISTGTLGYFYTGGR